MYINENMLHFNILEPIKLFLEKNYYLNVIKEIFVTDSFLSMEETVIKCQGDKTQVDCRTKKYIDHLINNCKCLPFEINIDSEVCDKTRPKVLKVAKG